MDGCAIHWYWSCELLILIRDGHDKEFPKRIFGSGSRISMSTNSNERLTPERRTCFLDFLRVSRVFAQY